MEMNEIIEKLNYKLGTKYTTIEEVEEDLSSKLMDINEKVPDMQNAFDLLNKILGDNILSDMFEYVLSDGGEWAVDVKVDLTDEMISALNKRGYNVEDKFDLASVLEHKVIDTECNVGCDARTALSLEMEDLPSEYDWENIVVLSVPEGESKIRMCRPV